MNEWMNTMELFHLQLWWVHVVSVTQASGVFIGVWSEEETKEKTGTQYQSLNAYDLDIVSSDVTIQFSKPRL